MAIYAAGGVVHWPQALLMMLAATAGGYGGARVARKLPAPVLRWGIVARLTAQPSKQGMMTLNFEVEDTGPGISPEELPEIFDAFYQAFH